MNINFKKLRFKNILSYGNEIQELNFKNGIDVISSGNGSGKSTISESLFFVLFGKPYRNIKKNSLINNINKKDLFVELFFSVNEINYKIQRGIKPNIFIIFKQENDDFIEIPERATVKEYQDYFENEILKINELSFRQLISISSTMTRPFTDLTPKEKEALFQTITDTIIFGRLEKTSKLKINEVKIKIKEIEYKNKIISEAIKTEENLIKQLEFQNKEFIEHKEKEEIDNLNEINFNKNELNKYKDGIEKLKIIKEKYDNLNKNKSVFEKNLISLKNKTINLIETNSKEIILKFETNLKDIENDFYNNISKINKLSQNFIKKIQVNKSKLEFISKEKTNLIKCKKCNEINYIKIDISEINKENIYKENIIINENKNKNLENKRKLLKENYEIQVNILKKEKEIKINEIKNKDYFKIEIIQINKEINLLLDLLDKYKEKLLKSKHIKTTFNEIKEKIIKIENKIKINKNKKLQEIDYNSIIIKRKEIKDLKEEYEISSVDLRGLEYISSIVSSKEEDNLKSKIIEKTIPFLNKSINYFLEKFSLNEYNFIIDNNFKDKIISRNSENEFNSLSNGQKMRITFGILFSFLKLIEEKNGTNVNILFLDEALDSSLDHIGRDELLNILKEEFSFSKDVLIITHNQDIKERSEIINRIITINKKDNFSSLIIN